MHRRVCISPRNLELEAPQPPKVPKQNCGLIRKASCNKTSFLSRKLSESRAFGMCTVRVEGTMFILILQGLVNVPWLGDLFHITFKCLNRR